MRSSLDLHLPDALNTLLLHTLAEGTRLSHKGRIRWAADAALLIAEGGINWRRLAQQAEQRRVALTTATALAYLATALEVPLPPEAPTRIPGGWRHGREQLINQLWSPGAQRWIEAFRLNHPELRGPERHGDGHPGPP